MRPEGLRELLPPPRDPDLARRQDVERELAERLDDREVRDVALVLLELARDQPAAPLHDRAQELAHQRGLADARVPRYQDQLRGSGLGGALERLAQRRALGVAAVQLLWDPELLGDVVLAERERRERTVLREVAQAALQIVVQAERALVAVVGQLRQQLADDVGQRARHRRSYLVERPRLARDVTVDPAHRVLGLERQPASEQLVEHHAERVQVRAAVDRPVHLPGLLGRDVRQRALVQRGGSPPAERGAHQHELPGRGVEQDAGRSDVLVDRAARVQRGELAHHADRQRQEFRNRHRCTGALIERGARAHRLSPPRAGLLDLLHH